MAGRKELEDVMRVMWLRMAVVAGAGMMGMAGCERQVTVHETPGFLPPVEFAAVKDLPVRKELPNPLVDSHGGRIVDPALWPLRREQMKEVVEYYEVGQMPPAPGNVKGVVEKREVLMEGKVKYELVKLSFGPEGRLSLEMAVFTPIDGAESHAAIVLPSFTATPGGVGITDPKSKTLKEVAPEDAAKEFANVLSRGYILATFYYQQCATDTKDDRASGFFAAYPEYDWGALAAYAWGMSRCADYLVSQPSVDKSKIIAVGHSRLGKACLIAGAFDERFAASIPAGSGAGGTGSYRINGPTRGGKQGLEDVTARFPHWFVPRLKDFSNAVEKLPFDQHWLIALTAPRPLLSLDSTEDPYSNAKAAWTSYEAAKPVYAFLHADDKLGISFRTGKHELNADDWAVILDFCDKELRGMKVERHFDEIPE